LWRILCGGLKFRNLTILIVTVTVGEIVLGAAHVTVKKYSHSLLQGGNPSKLD
jgi:hypothetical protein